MSELETRRAAAAAGETHPDMARTAELVRFDGAQPAEPDLGAEPDGADLDDTDPDGAESAAAELDGADADLLAIPPRADDLGTALAARPPRAKLPKATVALAAAALICAGFIGGALAQKHFGASSSGRGNFAAAFGNRTGAGAGGSGAAGGFLGRGGFGGATGTKSGAGGAITGTITVVSGDKLYVTAPDGSVYTVTADGSTVIDVTSAGSLAQLKPGQSVVIAGSNDNRGDVTATSITAGGAAPSTSGTKTSGGQ
ncbi:hypothetical protein KGA66_05825 [Actinocrinis puniceicyclus]|uniref:DUF5666 domain-containing protein n=1 Tax=Actinocrinis puniceicyclus TaxID=977794 RepID=A0A8J8BBY3_9ACTN|nr:DUF5666 domain-containing protein [Actinocrinis puniceicyclus]MBS2962556.1 hypothetical protein [Actinocrinis puniceicyclus]